MRIAVVDNLPVGGAKRVVFEQLKYLSRSHQIDFYTNAHAGPFKWENVCERMRVYEFNPRSYKGITRFRVEAELLTRSAKRFWEVAQEINASKADVVLVHPCMLTQAPMLIPWITKPLVYFAEEWLRVVYEPDLQPLKEITGLKRTYEHWRRKLIAHLDAVSVQKATQVVTTSQFNAVHLKSAYKTSATVLPLGVDGAVFKPAKNPQRNFFLFVGSRETVDGYDVLSEAIKLSPAKMVIKEVRGNGTRFALEEHELIRLYQHAAAVLCLARQEPFGLVALEAMACGTPVIAIDEGGYKETVVPNETGILIAREPHALYQAMKQLSLNRELLSTWGKNGRKRAQETYTWESHGKQLEKVLQEINYG